MSGYVNVYASATCESPVQVLKMAIGCSYEDHYYYYGPETFSYSMQCSASDAIPLTGSYSVQ